MFSHPLVPAALSLIAGIALAHALNLPLALLWLGAAGAAVYLALVARRQRRLPLAGLCIFFLLLGAARYTGQSAQVPAPDHLSRLYSGRPQVLTALVVRAPEPGGRSRHLVVEARALEGRPARGLVRLSLPGRVSAPPVGALIQARVRLRPFASFANPGGFDYAAHMARQGLFLRAYAGKRSGLRVLGKTQALSARLWLEGLRQELGSILDRLPPGPGRGLLRALVLGQRGELSLRAKEAFSQTGVAHLLAISGLHLGLIWGLAYLVLRLGLAAWPGLALRWPVPKLAAAGAFLPCAAYAALAGASTPTLRALVMALCLVAALMLDRPYRPAGALALAGLAIGLIWPGSLFTLSFQLSFAAVAAILLLVGPLARRVRERRGWGRLAAGAAAWLLLSGGVGLVLWPLAVLHFHQLPLLMLPANALMVPLVAMLVLPLALVGALLSPLWTGGALWLWSWALVPARATVELALWLGGLPGATLHLAGPGWGAVLLIYAALLALALLPARWGRSLGLVGLGVALLCWLLPGPPAPDGLLRAWILDVGQGSAAVIRLPRGQVLVVDGGGWPGSDFDFGRRVVAPMLWSRGFSRLEVLACSHAEADHAGGLPFLLRWFHPARLWTNGSPSRPGPYGRLLFLARQGEVPISGPAQLVRELSLGGARLLLAWPRPGDRPPRGGENDRSLWLGLGLGSCWLWLPGDNGPAVERLVAPRLPRGGQQVLVAPHHGGRGSCTRELLERIRPRAVVFSAGCGNRFGMPRPRVLARVGAAGARIYTTARRGCIQLVSQGTGWRIIPHLARPRFCGAPWTRPGEDTGPRTAGGIVGGESEATHDPVPGNRLCQR